MSGYCDDCGNTFCICSEIAQAEMGSGEEYMKVSDHKAKIKELEAQAIGAYAANAILEAKLAERSKQIGVACLEHDLVHSLKCGRCYEIMEEKLKVAVRIIRELQAMDTVCHLDDHFEFLETVKDIK